MTDSFCGAHPDRPALFRCDGCARLLCNECVREGHRLIFCQHCGERALALGAGQASTVPERQRNEKVERPYSFREALAYAFRGSGRLMLPAYVVLMTLSVIVPFAAYLAQFLLPGLLFEIVRTTSEGQIELPDWPDYADASERFREVLWLFLVAVTVFLPTIFFLYLSGFDLASLFRVAEAEAASPGLLPRLAGLAIGAILGVFSLGATGAHSSGWLAFRVDLHLRALFSAAGRDGLVVAGLVAAIVLVSAVVQTVLAPVPVLGIAIGAALSAYAMFTGAHLSGLVFRRHRRLLDPIYRD